MFKAVATANQERYRVIRPLVLDVGLRGSHDTILVYVIQWNIMANVDLFGGTFSVIEE